jgi:hypothetical protein
MSERTGPIEPEPVVPEHVLFMLLGVALTIALVWVSLP